MTEALARAMPLQGVAGGLLIGVSSALMLLGLGRIAGVSGLIARAVGLARAASFDQVAVAFIIGLLTGAFVFSRLFGPVESNYPESTKALLLAGLLVGFGSRLASGCTSGHGICGVSRLSVRSIAATATFIVFGAITAALMRALGITQ
jgi:uncharacterized membrane protein YedE/YeeE